jgi:hypothetical protein
MDKNFKKLIEELKVIKGQLKEDYFQEGEPVPGEEEQMGGGDQPDPALVQQPQANPAMLGQGNSEEEIAMHAQEIIQHEPIIGRIRETAIEGLKKYADHPTSAIYEFFKKVFLESDKVLTDTGGKK